jgi:hypothetical protein
MPRKLSLSLIVNGRALTRRQQQLFWMPCARLMYVKELRAQGCA